jgi:exopolyphosphatase/guanosine-5'-triphosphate,3'-diphosphate pyrophosphatase
MRISSIDVGSNAIRQVIVDVLPTGQWVTLKKFRAPLRLGSDVFSKGYIQAKTQRELVEVFKKMAKLNRKFKAQKVIALATSAMRDASNSQRLISAVKRATKIQIKTITGQTEAELIRLSIFKSQIVNFDTALLIDIGGGSAEFSILKNDKIISSQSYPLGVVRLLNLTQKRKQSVVQIAKPYLRKMNLQMKRIHMGTHQIQIAVGTGGNFDALSKLKLQLLKKTPNTNITRAEIKKIYSLWNKMDISQKENLNIRRDRIDVLGLAIELILETLNLFHIENVKIPLTGLKEGAIYSALT